MAVSWWAESALQDQPLASCEGEGCALLGVVPSCLGEGESKRERELHSCFTPCAKLGHASVLKEQERRERERTRSGTLALSASLSRLRSLCVGARASIPTQVAGRISPIAAQPGLTESFARTLPSNMLLEAYRRALKFAGRSLRQSQCFVSPRACCNPHVQWASEKTWTNSAK